MKPDRVVIDASVAAAVVLQEELAKPAMSYFRNAAQGEYQLVAPSLFRLECGNACWKRVQRRRLTVAEARSAADHFERLPVVLIDVAELTSAATDLALHYGVSVYDAMYVATAEYVGTSLVTLDRKLAFALRERGWKSVILLQSPSGWMKGTTEIRGDIVTSDPDDWPESPLFPDEEE